MKNSIIYDNIITSQIIILVMVYLFDNLEVLIKYFKIFLTYNYDLLFSNKIINFILIVKLIQQY